jgi:hypothetical protein
VLTCLLTNPHNFDNIQKRKANTIEWAVKSPIQRGFSAGLVRFKPSNFSSNFGRNISPLGPKAAEVA